MDVQALLDRLSPEEAVELKKALIKKTKKVKKEASPEFVAAKAALDAVIAENPELITRYEEAKEKLRGVKGQRRILATKGYTLDEDTGVICAKDTGFEVTTFGAEGWQSSMRNNGFTVGQIAAVSKKMRQKVVSSAELDSSTPEVS